MVIEDDMGPLLTVSEVGHLLHIHNNTVRRWSNRGLLRPYIINDRGDRRFRRHEVIRLLQRFSAR